MELKRLPYLLNQAISIGKKRLIAVNANDGHSLEAIAEAVKLNLVEATVTGRSKIILEQCELHGIDPVLFSIVEAETEELAAAESVKLAKFGNDNILMKGLISSDKFMRAILNKEAGLVPQGAVLSHVTVVDHHNYHKLLIVSDVAVIPVPTIFQKTQMIQYLKAVAIKLGVPMPKIALIAPTELVIPSLPSCTDAVELMKIAQTDEFKPAIVFGPMALDVAIDLESAQIKHINSEVAGDADCLLFPNIDAGNVFYKTNTKLCGAEQAAIVMGANVPVVLSSRGDSMQTKLNSIALAVIMSN